MKRVFSIVLICLLLIAFGGLGNIQAFAESDTFLEGGTFFKDQQGIRFSVYDLCSCQTISTIDMFTSNNYQTAKNILNNSSCYNAKGCKFEYLYDYKYNSSIDGDIEALNICGVSVNNGILTTADVNSYKGIIENNILPTSYLQPVDVDGYAWKASQNLRKLLRESDLSVLEEQVLNKLGFYVLSGREELGLEPFDSNYVLVIEPIFYFGLKTNEMGNFYFYGTTTEFAILDQKLWGRYVEAGKYYSYNGIHDVMGRLTLGAACAAVMTEQDRIFALDGAEPNADGSYPNDVRTIEIHQSIKNVADWYNDVYRQSSRDREWHRMANERVMNYYGVTTLKMRDLTYLTIDQATPKPVYHTGTKGIISFQTISNGERSYTPEYEEIISGGDYYGLKLVLKTLNSSTGSGRSMPDMEIISDGLPDGWDDTESAAVPKVTYIYKEFDVPQTPGVWRFKLEVYSAGSEETIYSSNTAIRRNSVDACYEFEVYFENIPVSEPPDASAGDLMPEGFLVPEFKLSALTASKPATSLSWSYYEAYAHTIEGVPKVSMIEHRATTDSYIKDGYAPTSYGNIPLKIKNGKLYTRSGYGIGVDVPFYDTVSSGKTTGFQNGFVLLPEYGFKNYGEKLEKVGDLFKMVQNRHSIYLEDLHNSDYSRVHFTPVWYPDGEYEFAVILLDCWTPAGQLWDYRTYTVTLNGTVYDDWYITRH